MHIELDNRQKQLVTELETVAKSKERILQQQEEGLLATVDGIRKESQQLQLALGATSQAKVLVLMEQLGQHLSSIDEQDFRPREIAEMGFHEAPLVLPEIHLVDATASDTTVTSTGDSFPVVLSTLIPLGRFEITGGTTEAEVKLQITNSAKGKYAIQPDTEMQDDQMVVVKLLGQHVKGSPVKISNKRGWSSSNTNNTAITNNKMVAIHDAAWGMIQEEFDSTSQPLVIKVDHKGTSPWTTLVLYKTCDVAYMPGHGYYPYSLAFHHSQVPINHTSSTSCHH